ncbi:MAG: hypothetical protein HOI55_01125 [Candidatus Marinimicrobia bacterium]|jgi:hypothetical protein|nr:hypothetical protein [Candidatus Neomarinimicrobiota bacterium]
MSIFAQSDHWKIEIIEAGLVQNKILQDGNGKFGFFDKRAPIYMPLSVYTGTDKINSTLPQGTLIQWRDKCIKMFETKIIYNYYIALYNEARDTNES